MIAMAEAKPDLAKYDIREEIGHGGMATVYLARDKRLGRDVALKIIHRHLRENAEVAARFASEARAVAKLKHPNIVEVYDVSDAADAEQYLVVELVRGSTLRALIAEAERLPAEIAAIVAVEIAGALDHAHQLGVIHRDVKPENVLVAHPTSGPSSDVRASNPDDTLVKITDFGIAKLLDAQGVTSTGQVLGSPAHMAPEQIEGGDVNARSDVFGLGVLLYEASVGRLPFDGKNPAQVLRRVLDGAFTPADKARPTVGHQFGAVIGKALAHEPAARYASAEEFARDLREELTKLGFADLRGELRAYLHDPKAYLEAYEPRIVERLMTLATEARAKKDIPCSAAYLNRALAFRPDDARLLAEVTSLGRSERIRRNVRTALLALGGSAVVAAAAFGLSRIETGSRPPEVPPRPTARTAAVPVPPPPVASSAAAAAPGEDDAQKPRVTASRRSSPRLPAPSASAAPTEAVLARVRIAVDGPANATVKVDGVELADWFGTQLIPVGAHVFEFIPPNTECCEPGEKLSIAIREPRGPDDLQKVRGRIAFKNAILDVRGPPGARASCAELGEFPVPSHQTFGMTSASRRASCTVIPPPGSGLPLKTFDVTLSPGRVSSVPPGP